MTKKPEEKIKILKGSIIKYLGHPVKLQKSYWIPEPDGFKLEDHEVMVWKEDDDELTNSKS